MTNKQKFIQEVSAFNLSPEALAFFETLKAEKATVVKEAILDLLKAYDSQAFDRTEIGNELYNAGEFPEEYLLNDKGTIAYNSITAFANQLVAEGQLKKIEVRVGKTKKVKYQF
jgi:hypothetical protein